MWVTRCYWVHVAILWPLCSSRLGVIFKHVVDAIPDDAHLCSDEDPLPISQICGIGIENESFSHSDDVASAVTFDKGNTTMTCHKVNTAGYGATDSYDQLRRDVNVQVKDGGSRKPYDHVNRQNLTKSAPVLDEQFYDVTNPKHEAQRKRPNSTYQSLVV